MARLRVAVALWSGGGGAGDGGAALRAGLRDAVPDLLALTPDGVQLNLDDEHVADAWLRLSTFDQPVVALVWLDVPAEGGGTAAREVADRALARLAPLAVRTAAWLCEAHEPLVAPYAGPGERAAGLANVAFVRRLPGLSDEDLRQRWLGDHTDVAIRTQATSGYVQNLVLTALTEDAPAVDALVEETFPIEGLTDLHAFYGSGGDDDEMARRSAELMASVARFADDRIDVVPSSRYAWRP